MPGVNKQWLNRSRPRQNYGRRETLEDYTAVAAPQLSQVAPGGGGASRSRRHRLAGFADRRQSYHVGYRERAVRNVIFALVVFVTGPAAGLRRGTASTCLIYRGSVSPVVTNDVFCHVHVHLHPLEMIMAQGLS